MALERGRSRGSSVVLALHGDLGAGKTTFTKRLAKKLGISQDVSSPTFVILKRYPIPAGSVADGVFQNLIHIDAYRLESGAELQKIGFMQAGHRDILCIEWPEIVEGVLPESRIEIRFEHLPSFSEGEEATETDNSGLRKVTIDQKM